MRFPFSRDFKGLQDGTRDAIYELSGVFDRPFGVPTPIQRENYNAKFGELVLCDPTVAPMTVTLPSIERTDLGRIITVANFSASTSAIDVIPALASETIDGATRKDIKWMWTKLLLICVTSRDWMSSWH